MQEREKCKDSAIVRVENDGNGQGEWIWDVLMNKSVEIEFFDFFGGFYFSVFIFLHASQICSNKIAVKSQLNM